MTRPTIRERLARWLAPRAESRSDFGSFNLGPHAPGSLGIQTVAGAQINARTALSISAVWAAVNCYTSTLGSLDWSVAERDERGGRRPAPEHPAYELLRLRPNPHTTSSRLRQAWVGHAATIGNGYLEIERDARGRDPVALHLMDPRDVKPVQRDGATYYQSRSNGPELEARDVLHLAMFGWDGLSAYSPIDLGRETLGVAASQRDYQAGLYANGAGAQGHLEIPGNLKSIEVAALRRNYNQMHQGPANAGNVGILEGGTKWVQTNFSPQDAEIILGAKLSVEEVARFWNLPQHKLNLLDHATFSNVEELNIDFYQSSIFPWVVAISQECDIKLIREPERVSYFTFLDVATITRGNTATQTAQEAADLATGVRSLNEVRIGRGLNPIDDPAADYHWVPVNNLQAIETMGKTPAPAPEPTPVATPTPTPAPTPDASALRDLLGFALGRMIRREAWAARRASKSDDFAGWPDAFYPDHTDALAGEIAPAARAAKLDAATIAADLVADSRRQLRELVVSIPPGELPEAVDRLCSRWEETRALDLARSLLPAPPPTEALDR